MSITDLQPEGQSRAESTNDRQRWKLAAFEYHSQPVLWRSTMV